jgi:hypothetical protein
LKKNDPAGPNEPVLIAAGFEQSPDQGPNIRLEGRLLIDKEEAAAVDTAGH